MNNKTKLRFGFLALTLAFAIFQQSAQAALGASASRKQADGSIASTNEKKAKKADDKTNGKTAAKTKTNVKWPKFKESLAAKSAILMDLNSGMILYEKNADKKEYPASITKIMTVLLALENCNMNEIVTFSHEAIYGIEAGSSMIGMDVGEKLTMEQCLYAIMLASANEVSLGVGEHISGSVEEFAKLMTKRAKELGCQNTHFVNANGLHHDDHYTSAHDMALIAREAMKHEEFQKITATRTYTIPPTNKHKEPTVFPNHHQMINGYTWPQFEYEYCTGGKTGFTSRAGNTLVTFAKKDGVDLVCVVMKDVGPKSNLNHNEYTDTTRLFNFGFENYKSYNISEECVNTTSDNFPLFTTFNAFFDPLLTPLSVGQNAKILLPNDVARSKAKEQIELFDNCTLKDGENIIGSISYTYGGKIVGQTDIIYTQTELPALTKVEATKEVAASNVETIEKFNLKPIIILVIFILILFCIWLYWYFMIRRVSARKNRRNQLHF